MIPKDEELGACVRFLGELDATRASPAEARAALTRLRTTLPGCRVDLVWDTETIGNRVTYAVLLSQGEWTYSIGAARTGALPWALRGATDPRAELLLTVDGTSISVGDAIGVLDFVWRTRSIADRLVDMALLAKEDDRHDFEASKDEVAAAIVRLRAERGLDDEPAFRAWLDERTLTEEQLASWIGGVLVHRKLEQVIVGDRVEREIDARPGDYVRARVAAFEVHERRHDEVVALVTGGHDVLEIAAAIGVGSVEIVDLFRWEAAAAFECALGATVLVAGNRVVKVLERETEAPASALRARVAKRLVAEHFRELRSRAAIEWHWGKTDASGTTFAKGSG